jgi:chromatin remodeling complex protein RSC6
MNREIKFALKISNRKNKRSGNRKPSGFVRPTLISEELAEFLSVPSGTEMARTDVSKEINNYIRLNSLQDKSNGRQINPDDKLRVLLNVAVDETLTYFNLQKYMKHHFIKTVPTELLVSEAGLALPLV